MQRRRNTSTGTHTRRAVGTAAVVLMFGSQVLMAHAQTGAGNGASGAGATGTTGAGGTGANAGAGTGASAGQNGAVGTANGAAGQTGTGNAGNGGQTGGGTGASSATGTAGVGSSMNTQGVNGSSGQTGRTGGAVSGQATGSLPINGASDRSVFDLGQTIVAAMASSSDLQVAARNVEIDRKRADEAAAAGRPNLAANGQATRFDKATEISLGGSPPIEVLPSHTEQLSINLSERLDITGQIRAAASQIRLQALADQFTYDYIRDQRILRAKTIYFDLLRAQHQVQVAASSLATAQRQLQDAQNLNAAQVGQRIDVYRAATQVANAQQQLSTAQNNFDISTANFNDLVGRPLSSPVTVIDVPGVNVGVDVSNTASVGAPAGSTFTPYHVAPGEVSGIDLSQSLSTAYARRPEILANQVDVRVAETGVTLARAGLQPTLSVDAAGNYFPTVSFQNPRKRTALVTATFSIPLYDGGATRDRVAEARLRTQNAQTTLESSRSDVALDVRQSYLNLSTAARQIDAADTALAQAIAARQLAQVRYEGQVGTYLEVTDAQSALVQAENSQVDAVYNYLVAKAQFENAIGTPRTQ